MSSRVTRSSARLAAEPTDLPETPRPTTRSSASSKKRKAPAHREPSPSQELGETSPQSAPRRTKRQKIDRISLPVSAPPIAPPPRATRRRGTATDTAMSNTGSSSKHTEEVSKPAASSKTSIKRPSSRSKKEPLKDASPSAQTPPARRQKKRGTKQDTDVAMKQEDENHARPVKTKKQSPPPVNRSDSNDAESPRGMDEESSDPFGSGLFGSGRGHPSGLSSTLRALSGMMSGMSSRLRDILNNLRQTDNPSMQLVALEELSNLLLVSNEDNLSGQFSPDPYVKELVTLMQPNPVTGEENPEMMLLACRCIANLMEALRGSVANVVYGGAVPVLCQKLLDIQYIDVAEQALSTLSKVSVDFPGSIVREGGLTACLQFLDFFATGTQRVAVTTAANCCRNIPHDSFPVIRDVMPILQNVLASHDQKVVEQGCLCVTRVIDSFKHSPEKLEQLVDPALLRAVLRLLLPGTTNLIGANIHTEFLRVLAIVAKASPQLSADLLRMNVVDTLYQILTGVSPPTETSDAASKIDSVVIMQALIHRPREQVYEALNVICELLPKTKSRVSLDYEMYDGYDDSMSEDSGPSKTKPSATEKRLELLEGCKTETRRFAMILLPTLTDAYSSTVNLSVRQKVLTAQLKMLSNLETEVIEEALRPVPYASFLASILSQEDHPSLVIFALQASELLFERLEKIYQYQFHREGVIGEIKKLANRPLAFDFDSYSSNGESEAGSGTHDGRNNEEPGHLPETTAGDSTSASQAKIEGRNNEQKTRGDSDIEDHDDEQQEDGADHDDEVDDGDEDENEIIVRNDGHIDDSPSSDSSDDEGQTSPHAVSGIKDLVILRSKKFLERYETSEGTEMRDKATKIRQDLRKLAQEIKQCYQGDGNQEGAHLFKALAQFFDGDALESITSSELLDSGVIQVLLDVLTPPIAGAGYETARTDFVSSFMGYSISSKIKTATAGTNLTPLTVLTQKLQDLLSRAEHFEVLTVNSNASESSRSNSTSMLSRQIRLKLTADADSDIPPSYREMIVSIHAIATFKALDDYLRPRITLSDPPLSSSRRRDMLQQLANARMQQLAGASESGLFSPFGTDLSPLLPGTSGEARPTSRLSSRTKSSIQDKAEAKTSEKAERKRSSRRQPASSSATVASAPAPEPETSSGEGANRIECNDEKAIIDDAEGDAEADEALEAIVGDLEDEMSDEEMPEPSAINMEIASTGKVTARQDDGTRVVTPLPPGTPVPGSTRSASSNQSPGVPLLSGGSIATAGRPYSYAAAVAAVPQDWHIQFSIDDKPIPKETTVYRAVHHNRDQPQDPSSRNVWSGIHTVKFRKVKGAPPTTSIINARPASDLGHAEDGLPVSLDDNPITASILSLLGVLHEVNDDIEVFQELIGCQTKLYVEPLASFINTKLTAKMNRQLEEPLIVASNCLPSWAEDVARLFPFLFPFETRHLFLQSTSFGYSRSMARWQNSQSENDERRDRRRDERPLMGRLQRQKVRISRSRILESAIKVMEMYGASPSLLEVEYFEEVGTGLGPTLEFYSTVSKEFSKAKLKLWRENDSNENDEYAFGKSGLFPAPMSDAEAKSEAGKKLLHFFTMLGKFVARSMLDSRIIDISFNPTFFKLGNGSLATPTLALVRTVDRDLANSLAPIQQLVVSKAKIESNNHMSTAQKARALQDLTVRGAHLEDLMLDFTLPGYPSIDLINNGSDTAVALDNVEIYVNRVLELTLGSGIQRQINAFQTGFSQVFSYSSLKAFTPNELVMLFGRVEEDWSIETLMDSIKADHGFNMDSKSIKNLLHTMSELTPTQRRDFLQFVTGSPKLPIGGFKSLTPMFTVVCKPSEPPYTSDDYLPSVMTCVNYLKLPDYTDQEVMRKRLNVAIREGQGAFHLS